MLTPRERQALELITRQPMISQRELATHLGISRSAAAGHVMRLTEKGFIRGRGYVLSEADHVAVVGGANIDIEGHSATRIVAHDSNPGTVRRSPGGVGRNIAHDLANLGAPTRLVTALGRDPDGQWLHDVTSAAGVDMGETLWASANTATYLSIVDANGEMAVAVNDMTILEALDAAAVDAAATTLASAALVVADCNLGTDALRAVAAHANTLFVDTVSAVKADRIGPHLAHVHTLKPNRLEAEVLTGIEIRDQKSLRDAATALRDRGVERVVISIGEGGVLVADEHGVDVSHGPTVDVASVTGAGDAMMAALAHAHLRGLDRNDAVRFGLAAAAIVATSPHTVTDDLTEAATTALMEAIPA